MDWNVHWQGGDPGFTRMNEYDLEENLRTECEQLVDECEQEINEGGHWDDKPEGEDIREREIEKLWKTIESQLAEVYRENGGTVRFDPWYAINQRNSYTVTIEPTAEWYRVTVDYGDDRLRVYGVRAETLGEAQEHMDELASSMLSVAVLDDYDEHDEDDYDVHIDLTEDA